MEGGEGPPPPINPALAAESLESVRARFINARDQVLVSTEELVAPMREIIMKMGKSTTAKRNFIASLLKGEGLNESMRTFLESVFPARVIGQTYEMAFGELSAVLGRPPQPYEMMTWLGNLARHKAGEEPLLKNTAANLFELGEMLHAVLPDLEREWALVNATLPAAAAVDEDIYGAAAPEVVMEEAGTPATAAAPPPVPPKPNRAAVMEAIKKGATGGTMSETLKRMLTRPRKEPTVSATILPKRGRRRHKIGMPKKKRSVSAPTHRSTSSAAKKKRGRSKTPKHGKKRSKCSVKRSTSRTSTCRKSRSRSRSAAMKAYWSHLSKAERCKKTAHLKKYQFAKKIHSKKIASSRKQCSSRASTKRCHCARKGKEHKYKPVCDIIIKATAL